jgi:hypothetical protein
MTPFPQMISVSQRCLPPGSPSRFALRQAADRRGPARLRRIIRELRLRTSSLSACAPSTHTFEPSTASSGSARGTKPLAGPSTTVLSSRSRDAGCPNLREPRRLTSSSVRRRCSGDDRVRTRRVAEVTPPCASHTRLEAGWAMVRDGSDGNALDAVSRAGTPVPDRTPASR